MAHSCFERVLQATVDTFRDGGFHGWVAVLGSFACKIAWVILVKGLGMMLPSLQEQFNTSTWLIGWMVAITEVGAGFAGFLATPLKERFGARTVVTVSGLIAGISMIIASYVSSLYVMTLILTLLTGPAIGIPFVITNHLIGCYFSKSITLAYGVGTLGASLTFVIVVPLIQLFLDIYGWRGTMVLLGTLLLHIAVCGALMKPPAASGSHHGYEAAHRDEEQEAVDDTVVPSNRFGCSYFTTVYSFARDTFKLGLFSSMSFWLVTFQVCVWQMLYTAWIIYYVQYNTVFKEFTLEDTSHFIVAYGIGRIVTCVVIGPLVQKVQVVGTYTWFGIALLLPAICYAVDPWLLSFWPITANAFVLGNAISMCAIIESVVLKEVFGKEQMGHVMGSTGLVAGMTNLLSLYFPGLIYDTTGEYIFAFSLMAGVQSLTVVSVILLYWRQKRRGATVPPPQSESPLQRTSLHPLK